MKKIWIFSLILLCGIAFFVSCEAKQPLEMKKEEIIALKDSAYSLGDIIMDYDSNSITTVSSDDSIAYISGNKVYTGNKYGVATIEINIGEKYGVLRVRVVPALEYLKEKAQSTDAKPEDKRAYQLVEWLLSNIDAFKNPSTVSVVDVRYPMDEPWDAESRPFYLVEIRAQNGFGGYTNQFFKLTSFRIEEADVYSFNGLGKYYEGHGTFIDSSSSYIDIINKALSEK